MVRQECLAAWFRSIRSDQVDVAREILAEEGNALLDSGLVLGDACAYGPLHVAAHDASPEMLQLLLETGAREGRGVPRVHEGVTEEAW